MIDPTSDVGEVTADDAPACAVCDELIVNSPDHRVVTWVADNEVVHRHFCSDKCRDAWVDE